ncbi:hypothetical protein [Collinsella sp. Sow4_E3]|jgi:hypothetical protein|uniref:hypothetical protein n=1 Tax=Collinsella sp. Sow4_E3 TaxID=3438776 RepID=UPI003F9344D4
MWITTAQVTTAKYVATPNANGTTRYALVLADGTEHIIHKASKREFTAIQLASKDGENWGVMSSARTADLARKAYNTEDWLVVFPFRKIITL